MQVPQLNMLLLVYLHNHESGRVLSFSLPHNH